jgi:hypothetical protein
MTRRAFRVLLFLGLLGAAALAGYQGWRLETARVRQLASTRNFDAITLRLAQSVIDLRASERAYVSAGQGYAFWKPRVDGLFQQIRQDLTALKLSTAPGAEQAADAALEALNEAARLEKRIAEASEAGRVQFAADLVYADGLQASLALERATNTAIDSARADLAAWQRESRMQELLLAAESACIGLFLALMWYPSQQKPAARQAAAAAEDAPAPRGPTTLGVSHAGARPAAAKTDDTGTGRFDLPLRPAQSQSKDKTPAAPAGPPSAPPAPPAAPPPATALAATAVNATLAASRETLVAAADLCTSMARVTEPQELDGLLAQMSKQLDATGVIVWLLAPDGLSLRPALSHGYDASALARLDRLDLASDNATARAFRLARPQTVSAKDSIPGAIVVPITTGAGCVGAVAAELRHGREQDAGTLALARIFAAQLAMLTGPAASATTSADTAAS